MLIPVILSGGAGTRLWPVSREGHPKPFMKLADGQSLLQKTLLRALAAAAPVRRVLMVTNRDYYFQTKDQAGQLGNGDIPQLDYLLEPFGRNTAAAIGLAALFVQHLHGPDALMLVLPSDHLITRLDKFNNSLKAATQLARQDYLVTFGIQPTAPETGYGYIESGAALEVSSGYRVQRFVEKPDLETATGYVASGRFFWNSGMFCMKASTLMQEMARCSPEVTAAIHACWDSMCASGLQTPQEIPAQQFETMPDISIDYAVMERSERVAVVRAAFDWSDIGSWSAVSELFAPDEQGNRTDGEVVTIDSDNNFILSSDRLIATIGLSDMIVVDTPDALLVARADKAQDVKKVVGQLKKLGHEAYRLHRTVCRPWGTYTVLEAGERYKIKRIEVKPGASLSLQMHHHRSEHWIVVSGTAKIINGDTQLLVRTNESTYIPAGCMHRLENPGMIDLVMIEVQSGEYLGEDDIVRFDDQYGRA